MTACRGVINSNQEGSDHPELDKGHSVTWLGAGQLDRFISHAGFFFPFLIHKYKPFAGMKKWTEPIRVLLNKFPSLVM